MTTDKEMAESIRRCIGNLNDQLCRAAEQSIRVDIETAKIVIVNGTLRTMVSAEIAKVL